VRPIPCVLTSRVRLLLAALILAVVSISFVGVPVYTLYFVLPQEDKAFLTSRPNRQAVLQRFGNPAEDLQSGARFPMTGWHPLPSRQVSGAALSFVRPYGSKLYLYFEPNGRLEEYVISRS
jgi:hypothetical protein